MLNLVVVLIIVGVLLYLVNQFLPMDAKIKQILNIVVVIVVILYVLSAFGVLPALNTAKVPHFR
jgi:multisubunit Na+/H+ antiporter MnhB subunit